MQHQAINFATRRLRSYLVGSGQRWVFERPPVDWLPAPVGRTSLYLHLPFCRHFCPYCPYTKFPYRQSQIEPYTKAAINEVEWWARTIGPAEITSVYIGGGTPTLALESVAAILRAIRKSFQLTGDICIETSPLDLNEAVLRQLQEMEIGLVSLGVQSFQTRSLEMIGRRYSPTVAENALTLLAQGGFASVNADIMFALPQQTAADVLSDLDRAAALGANQVTTYPLFTFPYTSVGRYLHLKAVRMPDLRTRHEHYMAISLWCMNHGFQRVSVWSFKQGSVPRYSSVTRDGYIGVGPGAGSHLPDGFVLNCFDLQNWMYAVCESQPAIALRMPFTSDLAGWWWLYWRLYDTVIPLDLLDEAFSGNAGKARRWLTTLVRTGLAVQHDSYIQLTDTGAFWLHLIQNYFALNYVNKLWTQARQEPWPASIAI